MPRQRMYQGIDKGIKRSHWTSPQFLAELPNNSMIRMSRD
jgi:hypothetical protein